MPHMTVEYSANIEATVRIDELIKVLHEAAASTGIAELAGFRTRAERRDLYRVADADPANSFMAIMIRIAQGRSAEDRRALLNTVTDAATAYLEPLFATMPVSFSCEVQEIIPDMRINKSNIRAWMKTRESAA